MLYYAFCSCIYLPVIDLFSYVCLFVFICCSIRSGDLLIGQRSITMSSSLKCLASVSCMCKRFIVKLNRKASLGYQVVFNLGNLVSLFLSQPWSHSCLYGKGYCNLQRLSEYFLQKTINHFTIVHMTRNDIQCHSSLQITAAISDVRPQPWPRPGPCNWPGLGLVACDLVNITARSWIQGVYK